MFMDVVDWIIKNSEWLFSGIAAVVIGGFLAVLRSRRKAENLAPMAFSTNNSQNVNVNVNAASSTGPELGPLKPKELVRILFVDDDTTFKVVKILRADGWRSTRIVKDIASLDDPDIRDTDIFFVDIQGVGKILGFKDEGLGLVRALKERFPRKKVVIYSAEATGDRFHGALRLADDRLSKDADPYEFIRTVSTLSQLSAGE